MYKITGTTISMKKGDTFICEVTIYDAEGNEYTPKAGETVTFELRKTYWDATPKITKSLDTETMILQLAPADTEELATGRYEYTITIVLQGGIKDTFISGTLILEA